LQIFEVEQQVMPRAAQSAPHRHVIEARAILAIQLQVTRARLPAARLEQPIVELQPGVDGAAPAQAGCRQSLEEYPARDHAQNTRTG